METDDLTPSAYKKALLRRTKNLREGRGLTQAEAAKFLGLALETYKKYETRSPLPHQYINDFCILVDTTETFFLTGKSTARQRSFKRTG